MSGYHLLLKKPKIEIEEDPEEEEKEEEDPEEEENEEEDPEEEYDDGEMEEQIRNEQEEALVDLIEHRTKEVERLCQRITYYKSQAFKFLWGIGGDDFDSMNMANAGMLEIATLSFDEPDMEGVLFDDEFEAE